MSLSFLPKDFQEEFSLTGQRGSHCTLAGCQKHSIGDNSLALSLSSNSEHMIISRLKSNFHFFIPPGSFRNEQQNLGLGRQGMLGGGWECRPESIRGTPGTTRRQRKIKKQKRYFITLIEVKGKKTIKNSRPDFATFWVNGFPQSFYLYISIPDSKVNETCITHAYSYWEHCTGNLAPQS